MSYSYEEALAASTEYFDGDDLAAKVWVDKYCLRNGDEILEKTPEDMHWRMAKEFARIQKKKYSEPMSKKQIFDLFDRFKWLCPQGSPMFGIGNKHSITSLSNCFYENTNVFTTDGVKKITDVEVGDYTVTHDGSVNRISQVHKNKLNGRKLLSFKCFRTPLVTATDNHEFLSISKEQLDWGYSSPVFNALSYLRVGDYICIPKRELEIYHRQEYDISEVLEDSFSENERDYIVDKRDKTVMMSTIYDVGTKKCKKDHQPINKVWSIDKDFAYFIGLWYGDGCVFSDTKSSGIRNRKSSSKSHKNRIRGITFTLGSHEKTIIDFVVNKGESLFGISADVNDNKHIDGTTQIVFHSTLIGTVFERMFGRRCDGKFLHQDMFKWSKNLFMKLLQGLVDSDGCITDVGGLRVVLNNKKLIEQFYHIARSHGLPLGISYGVGKHKYARLDFPNGFNINTNKSYKDDRVESFKLSKESKGRTIKLDGYTLVRIDKKYESNLETEYVYTLGVEDVHSYSVEGLISLNCYVIDGPNFDSYSSILNADEQLVNISKRRGGVGICLNVLRPSGTPTKNAAKTSTGIVSWMERYSNSIREVGQNSRRGALMVTLSIHHPDILDFCTIKNDNTRVTGANISVCLTDEFRKALKEEGDYELRWPVDAKKPKISKMVSAKKVWDTIINSAWMRAEPGILNWDEILRGLADCYDEYRSVATNPCSEIPLSPLDSCRLMAINLLSYVKDPFTETSTFEWEKFYEHAQIAQRLMDDLVDLESEKIDAIIAKIDSDPEPDYLKQNERDMWVKIKKANDEGRRTGLGITALGDTLAAMGTQYGSEASIGIVDQIYRVLKLGSYRASVDMAKELGHFTQWDHDKEKSNKYLKRLWNDGPIIEGSPHKGRDIYRDMKIYGRRNVACLTTAPTGSLSILTQTSSGIEPVFMLSYKRRTKINPGQSNTRVDFVDQNGDSWQEFVVYHPTVKKWMAITGETDVTKSPWYNSTANDINWEDRVRLQAAAGLHVDHSISSTINLPNDVSEETVSNIYNLAFDLDIKGITIYRDGCRSGVLVSNDKTDTVTKRPVDVPCEVHHVTVKSEPYFVLVGIVGEKPYEIFAGRNGFIDPGVKSGIIHKMGRPKCYRAEFDDESVLQPITATCSDGEEALCRMVSMALRHNVEIQYIVDQLQKTQGPMTSLAKAMARSLKKYITEGARSSQKCPDCKSNMVFSDGCSLCRACGYTACN